METLIPREKVSSTSCPPSEDACATLAGEPALGERLAATTRAVREGARAKQAELEDYVRAHPVKAVLVAGGIGAALGVALGALLARR